MGATGRGVVVAVLDSGIDPTHPHFREHRNLELPAGLEHRDFLTPGGDAALVDEFGHGTGLASVVAGEYAPEGGANGLERIMDPAMGSSWEALSIPRIAGMAPEATLLSLKVIGPDGKSKPSDLLAGLDHLNEVNGRGTNLRVHVALIGLGFDYDAAWFACGQSPLCVEAARLVRGGVVVVAASGNTGYGFVNSMSRATQTVLPYSINDPGNAEPVLTIGSTHRDLPGVYGASYFSSRGPTHDGRPKPDLLAPGDRIMCAAAGQRAAQVNQDNERRAEYAEDSGTSLAAHVAGVVVQMLSVRRALHGSPTRSSAC